MLLAALLAVVILELSSFHRGKASEQPTIRASKIYHVHRYGFQQCREIPPTACVHHTCGSGLLTPWWHKSGSPHSHHELTAHQWLTSRARLPWAILYTTGMVAAASAKVVISRLANEIDEQDNNAGDGPVNIGAEDRIKSAMISFIKVNDRTDYLFLTNIKYHLVIASGFKNTAVSIVARMV